jgi:flagellar assembly protein FliH
MTSTSPEPRAGGGFSDIRYTETVLRGDRAGTVSAARFETDLRSSRIVTPGGATRLHAEAQAAGYAAGWAQGQREAFAAAEAEQARREAQAQAEAEAQAAAVMQALDALAAAAVSLEHRTVPVATELEDAVVRAAFALTETLLGRELAVAEEPGRDAIGRVLALAPAGRPVTVRLHPNDHATLSGGQSGVITLDIEGRTVTLVPDPALRSGDAVAECDASMIDARLDTALARVREVLGL